MNIPPGDQQTYVAHHHDSNLRRSVAQETFVKTEDTRKKLFTVEMMDDCMEWCSMLLLAKTTDRVYALSIEDLIAPPTGILPTLQVLHAPDGFDQCSQQQLRVNHVYPHVAILSVRIYPDGRMVENPQGYPVNPRRAQQLANPSDMLMDEEDVKIVDLLDDEDNNPHLTVIDYHTVKPDPNYSHDRTARCFCNLAPEGTALDRYVEFGMIWHQQNYGASEIVKMMKNHADLLKKRKQFDQAMNKSRI